MTGMTGRVAALSVLLTVLATAPAAAQEAGDHALRSETCAEVSLDGDFHLKIPCPPGTRDLLKQLPRPTEPAPRRDIVIDPKWPHDQAMVADHDWPQDWAMVAPEEEKPKETVPLLDELLGLFGPYLSGTPAKEGKSGKLHVDKKVGHASR